MFPLPQTIRHYVVLIGLVVLPRAIVIVRGAASADLAQVFHALPTRLAVLFPASPSLFPASPILLLFPASPSLLPPSPISLQLLMCYLARRVTGRRGLLAPHPLLAVVILP